MDIHDIHAMHYWKKCVEAEQKDEEMGYPESDSESESDATCATAAASATRPTAMKYYRSYRYNRDRCYIILAYACVAYMMYWSFTDVNRSEN
jgi:t-SNARE complex subunit (syntaxin)